MGLFDFLKGNPVEKHKKRVASKGTHEADRWASIQALGEMGSPDAVDALLGRFNLKVTPSITDQSEKEFCVRSLVKMGEVAVGPTTTFLKQTEKVSWPLAVLQELITEEQVVTTLLEVLDEMTTDYERDPQRKVDVLCQLETRKDGRIVDEVKRFLEDASEAVRFHTAATIGAQAEADTAKNELMACFEAEEGVRVRVAVLDVFVAHNWSVGDQEALVSERIPPGYSLDGGHIKKN